MHQSLRRYPHTKGYIRIDTICFKRVIDLPVQPTSSFFRGMSSRHERPREWGQEPHVCDIHLQSMLFRILQQVIYGGYCILCGVKPRQTPSTCPNRALLAVARMRLDLGVPGDDVASSTPGSLTLGVVVPAGMLVPMAFDVPASERPGVDMAISVGSIMGPTHGGTHSSMRTGVVSAGDSRVGSDMTVRLRGDE
jgi:hypothetical protein